MLAAYNSVLLPDKAATLHTRSAGHVSFTSPAAVVQSCRHAAGHPAAAVPHTLHCGRDSRAVAAAIGRRELLGGLAPCCCCGSCVSNRREWYDKFFALSMVSLQETFLTSALYCNGCACCTSGPSHRLIGVLCVLQGRKWSYTAQQHPQPALVCEIHAACVCGV
jgi:hypothetical protein